MGLSPVPGGSTLEAVLDQSKLRESLRAIRLDHELPEGGPGAHRAVLDAIAAGDPEAAASAAVVEPVMTVLDTLAGTGR